MTAIVLDRTARKEHTCGRCHLPIRPGSRYREWKLPPGDDTVGNIGWWRDRVHFEYADCVSHPCGGRCPLRSEDDGGYGCCACDVVEAHEARQAKAIPGASTDFDHRCPRCLTPHPVLPDHWAVLDWAESHKCAEARKARAA